jgi:DNA-binding winged helix-turn-helix (wHTH) protein/tetratricopeptide (TPR) repeat protein
MLQFGRYQLDEARRLLSRDGTRLPLEPRVFDLLAYLIQNRERAVPHQELLKQVWAGAVVERAALSVAAGKLRKALEAAGEASCIETVHGFGLRFRAEVRSCPLEPEAACVAPATRPGAGTPASTPALTVLAPRRIPGASRDVTLLTCRRLLAHLHQYRVLPVVDAELVTDRTGRLRESVQGSPVRYVLSADVCASGSGFEGSAHLTDLVSLCVVWSRRIRIEESDLVTAADRLSAQLVAALWTAFMLGRVALPRAGTAPDAWARCCAGWHSYWTETWEGMHASLPLFERALHADAANPWARVGRSLALFTRYYFDPEQVQLLDSAKRDVAAVLDEDPESVLAKTYQAIYLRAAGQPELAHRALEEAQRRTPELGWIACNRAELDVLDDPAHAARRYDEALQLDAGNDLRPRLLTGLATARRLLGDFEGSVDAAERAILAKPTVPYGYLQAAASWGALGSRARGRELLGRLRKHVPTIAPGLVHAHIRLKGAHHTSYGEQTLPSLHSAGWGELC